MTAGLRGLLLRGPLARARLGLRGGRGAAASSLLVRGRTALRRRRAVGGSAGLACRRWCGPSCGTAASGADVGHIAARLVGLSAGLLSVRACARVTPFGLRARWRIGARPRPHGGGRAGLRLERPRSLRWAAVLARDRGMLPWWGYSDGCVARSTGQRITDQSPARRAAPAPGAPPVPTGRCDRGRDRRRTATRRERRRAGRRA